MSIRVLIVDHHEQIRRLVQAFFLSEFGFEICGEAVGRSCSQIKEITS
jgi:DNA-binding NarL/FixJ family response regulator